MTPPTTIEEERPARADRRAQARRETEDRLEIRIHELLSDVAHEMGEAAALEKDGVEQLQVELAASPEALGEGLRLVRREWPTDIGPVDLMCRDAEDGWLAVEIKRVADRGGRAAHALPRRIRIDPAMTECAGVLAAQQFKPQAVTLAEARGIRCVEVDLEVLRGRGGSPSSRSSHQSEPARRESSGPCRLPKPEPDTGISPMAVAGPCVTMTSWCSRYAFTVVVVRASSAAGCSRSPPSARRHAQAFPTFGSERTGAPSSRSAASTMRRSGCASRSASLTR